MADSQRYAKVPAEMGRAGWQKNAEHTATAGALKGRGTSQARALEDLSAQLATIAGRAGDFIDASVWADETGIWFAFPDLVNGGHHAVRVSGVTVAEGAFVTGSASGSAPVGEAFAASVGMRRIGRPGSRA